MAEGFSGEPVTRWTGGRNMRLVEALSFEDRKGKIWEAPAGSEINVDHPPGPLDLHRGPLCGELPSGHHYP